MSVFFKCFHIIKNCLDGSAKTDTIGREKLLVYVPTLSFLLGPIFKDLTVIVIAPEVIVTMKV